MNSGKLVGVFAALFLVGLIAYAQGLWSFEVVGNSFVLKYGDTNVVIFSTTGVITPKISVNTLCINGDCRDTWPLVSSGGLGDVVVRKAYVQNGGDRADIDLTLTASASCPDGYVIKLACTSSAICNDAKTWDHGLLVTTLRCNLSHTHSCVGKTSCSKSVYIPDCGWDYGWGAAYVEIWCVPGSPYYCDNDGDGYISASPSGYYLASPPSGCTTSKGTDCDDSDPLIFPGSEWGTVSPDGKDNDCDGRVDEQESGYAKLINNSGRCSIVCQDNGLTCVSIGLDNYASNGRYKIFDTSINMCVILSGGNCNNKTYCSSGYAWCSCPGTYCKCSGTVYK